MKGETMNLYDLMMKRRSVRVFKDQEISESIIEQMVDVANPLLSSAGCLLLSDYCLLIAAYCI
jgi:hypothetical protein